LAHGEEKGAWKKERGKRALKTEVAWNLKPRRATFRPLSGLRNEQIGHFGSSPLSLFAAAAPIFCTLAIHAEKVKIDACFD